MTPAAEQAALCKAILWLRQHHNVSRLQVARNFGRSYGYVRDLETGCERITPAVIDCVAKTLNIEPALVLTTAGIAAIGTRTETQ